MKNKNIKKVLSLMLSSTLLIAALSGCGSKDSDVSNQESSADKESSVAESSVADSEEVEEGLSAEAGTFPLTEEKKELTVLIRNESYIGDLTKNEFYKWYEEKTNVHVNFIEVEPSAMTETLNLMLVNGEYPDILMCGTNVVTPTMEITYGSQGIFLPLNDYIEKWGKETQEVFSLYGDMLPNAITAPDGNIYSLPNINDCYHCTYTNKLWINQTWLDALNLETPTTTEEFREVLRAFKEQDPNGNGKADEIPMMGYSGGGIDIFLLNSFLYTSSTMDMLYVNDEGTVVCAATQPEFKEGLAYIKSLVDEGLLDASTYTQNTDQLKQFVQDPEAVKCGVFPNSTPINITGNIDATPDQRTKNYVGLAPLEGPEGYQNTPITGQPYYSGFFIITDACEDPELAFRWADGLYSEEATINSQIGLLGIGREELAADAKGINGEAALYKSIVVPSGEENFIRAQNITLARRTADFRLGQYVDYSDPDYKIRDNEVRLYETTRDYYEPYAHAENHLPNAYLTEEETSEVAQLSATVQNYIQEQMALFILGTRDLEKDWDSYLKEFEVMNLDRLIEIRQAAYDRQYK